MRLLLRLQVIESLMELLVSVRHWNPRVLGMDDDGEAKKVRLESSLRLCTRLVLVCACARARSCVSVRALEHAYGCRLVLCVEL